MMQKELDAAIDSLAERIEIAAITNKVLAEKLDDIELKLNALQSELRASE
jgi:flagellar biosynthesis regulator FlaF